jgi:(heptosyl)LPS beta-1,4-glucosyltransferase
MTFKKTLSVCMAVSNEEANIGRCIKSVYQLADEVIVVDGESTDKTVEIAKSFGSKVKVIHAKNVAMFHKNKQIALDNARGEWILQLDADEEVSAKLAEEIKQAIAETEIKNSVPEANWLPRLNYFLNRPLRKGGQYPDYTLRLYKNGVAHFPCKSIHEQVEISKGKQVGYLKSPLYHYPYQNMSSYIQKWDRYCTFEATVLKQSGKKISFTMFINFFIVKPKWWFFKTYFRHLGFQDGFVGFVFSLFSSIRFWLIYIKLYEQTKN